MRERRRHRAERRSAKAPPAGLRFAAGERCTRTDGTRIVAFLLLVVALLAVVLRNAERARTVELHIARPLGRRGTWRVVAPWSPIGAQYRAASTPARRAFEEARRDRKFEAAARAEAKARNESRAAEAHSARFARAKQWLGGWKWGSATSLRSARMLNASTGAEQSNISNATSAAAAQLVAARRRKRSGRTWAQIAVDEAAATAAEVQRQQILRAFDAPSIAYNGSVKRYLDRNATTLLVFLHVPRSAGSVVKRLLLRWRTREGIAAAGHLDDVLAMRPATVGRLRVAWGYRGYGLHRQPAFAAAAPTPPKVVYYAMFREPVARLVSQYRHRAAVNATFLAWLVAERAENPSSPWFASGNPTVRQMCCWWTPFEGHALGAWSVDGDPAQSGRIGTHEECTPSEEVLQCAMENIETFVAVGISSDVTDAVDRLSYAFGIPNVGDVAARAPPPSKAPYYELSDIERATAVAHSKWDIRLHHFVKEVVRRQEAAAFRRPDFEDEVQRLKSGEAAPESAGSLYLAGNLPSAASTVSAASPQTPANGLGALPVQRRNLSNISGWRAAVPGFNAIAMALVDAAKTARLVAKYGVVQKDADVPSAAFVARLHNRGHERQVVLCFLHIPCTAGSVLQRMLRRWSQRTGYAVAGHLDDVLAMEPARQAELRAMWGHRGFGVQRQPGFSGLATSHGGSRRQIEFVALFREPVARIVSQFERRVRKQHALKHVNASFLEWFAAAKSELTTSPWHASGNPVVRQMCCWWTPFPGHELGTWSLDADDARPTGVRRQHEDCYPSEKTLQCAMANVERFAVVGLADDVQDAVDRLSYAFGIPNIGDVARWRNSRGVTRPFYVLSDAEREIVVKRSKYDIRLYHFVQQLVARQKAAAARLPDYVTAVRALHVGRAGRGTRR